MYDYNTRMPNKTIYIKDADMKIWEEAQKQLGGESISSIIIENLKERLRSRQMMDKVESIREVIAEVNSEENLEIELHPSWSPVILDANSLDIGYKLHEKNAKPDRVMSLIVDLFNFDRHGKINPASSQAIKRAIAEFWDGKRTDVHVAVRIGEVDIPSRLRNMVGKRGLVKIAQAGEIGFKILAVHPADDLPQRGDDEEFQRAISRTDFTVQFEDGFLADGSSRTVISGFYISLIRGSY